jgi:hypothetical protein
MTALLLPSDLSPFMPDVRPPITPLRAWKAV